MEKIRTNTHNYSIIKNEDKFLIFDGETPLKTPGGNEVSTLYEDIANRILDDIDKFGYDYRNIDCILAWHFTTIDNFSKIDDKQQVNIMINSFLGGGRRDWTFTDAPSHPVDNMNWTAIFGTETETYINEIVKWLCNCTTMQRVAACCVANAYESINLAYIYAKHIEKIPENERDKTFKSFAKFLEENNFYNTSEDFINTFNTFKLYYGIHFKEHGAAIED